MKKLILALLLFSSSSGINAQFITEWVKTTGGTEFEYARDIVLDSELNIIIAGDLVSSVGGTFDLDPGPLNTQHVGSSNGDNSMFLAKYDSLGNHLWSFPLVDSTASSYIKKIAIDAQDNIYICGILNDTVDFDPGPEETTLYDTGLSSLFLAKYDSEGDLIDARNFVGSGSEAFDFILADDAIYLGGTLRGTNLTGFNDSTTTSMSSSDGRNGFIAKYGLSLNHLWTIPIAQGPNDFNYVQSIAYNPQGYLYAAGVFTDSAQFCSLDTCEIFMDSNVNSASDQMFIAKYDLDGQLLDTLQIGSIVSFEYVEDVFDAIVDSQGNLILGGWFSGLMDFNPGGQATFLSGDNDAFLAKYDSDLNLIWAHSINGSHYDIIKSIALDNEDNIVVHGQHYANVDLDPGPNEFILNNGSGTHVFTAYYDPEGDFITAFGFEEGYFSFWSPMDNLHFAENGALYLCGSFNDSQDFDIDDDEEDIRHTNGNGDLFFGKFIYRTPIDPFFESVSPTQITSDGGVTLNISGYDMDDVVEVRLISENDSISDSGLDPITDFNLAVQFFLEGQFSGFVDLKLIMEDTVIIAQQIIEVLPSGLQFYDGNVDYLSPYTVIQNRLEPAITEIGNKSSQDLIMVPVTFIGVDSINQFENIIPTIQLEQESDYIDLVQFLESNSIDPAELNEIVLEDGSNYLISMIVPRLASGESKTLFMRKRYVGLGITDFGIALHPNGLLQSNALSPSYSPAPSLCLFEMMHHAFSAHLPTLDITEIENCFEFGNTDLQSFLLDKLDLDGIENQIIPLKGMMMKLSFDMISCLDPGFQATPESLDALGTELARLLASPMIIDETFDCSQYVQTAETFHSSFDQEAEYFEISNHNVVKISPQCQALGISTGAGCFPGNDWYNNGVSSVDPNVKFGPFTAQSNSSEVNQRTDLLYTIHFENVDSADIAAKQVIIIDSLDISVFDINSLQVKYAHWGDTVVPVDLGSNLIDLRPEHPNLLSIDIQLDSLNGVLTWDFSTLDTLTLQLTFNVFEGFLPPNVNSPEGMGSVSFSIDLREDVISGDFFSNDASIFFDFNDPIFTPNWNNLLDEIPPESHVNEITDMTGPDSFNVSWESDDPVDPIFRYFILFKESTDIDWNVWQDFTNLTEAEFIGEIGKTYDFVSVAVDSAMNVEEQLLIADASVTLSPNGLENHGTRDSSFELVPNPSDSYVIISFNRPELQGRLEVFDLMGRSMVDESISGEANWSLDVSKWPRGAYSFVIRSKDHIEQKMFLKW